MEYKVLDINKVYENTGRMYTKETVGKALENTILQELIKNKYFPVTIENEENLYSNIEENIYSDPIVIDISNIIGVVRNFRVDDEGLYADVEFFMDDFEIRPKKLHCLGFGDLTKQDDFYIVNNFNIEKIYALAKEYRKDQEEDLINKGEI